MQYITDYTDKWNCAIKVRTLRWAKNQRSKPNARYEKLSVGKNRSGKFLSDPQRRSSNFDQMNKLQDRIYHIMTQIISLKYILSGALGNFLFCDG